MKKTILALALLFTFSSAETANQVGISDLKEAVYKLILLNKKSQKNSNTRVVYKKLPLEKSHLDKYIKDFVAKNKKIIPAN